MQQTRLAVISYHTCPISDEGSEIGGMNVYVLELSKELAKKGYIVDIFTRVQSKKSPEIVQVSKNLRVIHLRAGLPKHIVPKNLKNQIPEFLKNFYRFTKKESIQYDVLSCHYYLSGIVGLDIKKKYKLPLLMTFHTLALMKNLVAKSNEEKETLQRVKTELELVKKADMVIATSPNDAEYIASLYNCPREKISVLMPGINFELFYPIDKKIAKKKINADPTHRIILFVGRIQPLKGLDVLIYSLKILLKRNNHTRLCLWIVGGDVKEHVSQWSKELQKLEQLRKILHIGTSIQFVGRKEQHELANYYSAAEMVVMPSQYEAFGMTALEAMACGTPVITTDATGIAGIFDKKHESLITSANNPLMLADKIQELLVNDKKHEKMSAELYKNVQDLSWENVAEEFMSVCKSCSKD